MIGRKPATAAGPADQAGQQLAALEARVDQVLRLVADTARHHAANRALVDLACDVRNTLRPQLGPPVSPGPPV
ncbi:MAG TPA: hypothetical protein VFM37_14970 [Pseudonocardiaceae bacterium]|nr:hypothetical protein [Pseudonocardiaceae bacterium]